MAHPLEDAPDRPELSVVVPTYGWSALCPSWSIGCAGRSTGCCPANWLVLQNKPMQNTTYSSVLYLSRVEDTHSLFFTRDRGHS